MFKDNLIMLRKARGFSQEEISEKIGISRQAYGKWESGETIPDIEKCAALARVYDVTVDSLLNEHSFEKVSLPPAPKGKHIFGTVTVNERGQIVIPKEARSLFGIEVGSRLVVLGDESEGLALMNAEDFEKRMRFLFEGIEHETQ